MSFSFKTSNFLKICFYCWAILAGSFCLATAEESASDIVETTEADVSDIYQTSSLITNNPFIPYSIEKSAPQTFVSSSSNEIYWTNVLRVGNEIRLGVFDKRLGEKFPVSSNPSKNFHSLAKDCKVIGFDEKKLTATIMYGGNVINISRIEGAVKSSKNKGETWDSEFDDDFDDFDFDDFDFDDFDFDESFL